MVDTCYIDQLPTPYPPILYHDAGEYRSYLCGSQSTVGGIVELISILADIHLNQFINRVLTKY